jgi:DNA-binding response OmpR family regulator
VSRDELLENVWGYDFAGDTNIVDVYIRYLRQKIDDRFSVKTIHTIRAVGYMFRYEPQA